MSKMTKGVGKNKAEAFRQARQANAVLAGMEVASPLVAWVSGVEQHSLTEWVPLYKELWANGSPTPKETTVSKSAAHLNRIAAADFAWRPIKDITTAHVAKFLADLEKSNGPGAATNTRTRMSDVFQRAETHGLIESGRNPVTNTRAPTPEVKRERLSLEQFLTVRTLATPWLQNAMDLALLTAQRREDIASIKFSDVRDGYLFVVQGKSKSRDKIQLQISLSVRLEATGKSIEDVVRQCRDDILSPFLVHHMANRGRGRMGAKVGLNGMSEAFSIALESTGYKPALGRTPPSFHEIRSLSERLYNEQHGDKFAQSLLGHKSAKMTSKYDDLRGSGWQVVDAK